MATNAEVIMLLENAQDALQKQCNNASGARVMQLITIIHQLADEIDAIEVNFLNNASYVPTTDPFKKITADGQAFLATLNSIKNIFSTVIDVVTTLTSVIQLVLLV